MVLELLFEYGEHESSSVAQILNVVHTKCGPDPSSRVVTRARIGFRARVTYFELGCPETNIDPIIFQVIFDSYFSSKNKVVFLSEILYSK